MKALMRDKAKRRYRHNWERAIQRLEAASRGRDRPAGLLETARARYALYRWSADEADRDVALRLAGKSARLGEREARTFAAAIRREAGDDRSARPAVRRSAHRPEPARAEEEEPPDPALEAALADLSAEPQPAAARSGAPAAGGPARVTEVRTWSSDDYTRVAIYLSHWVGWNRLELPAERERPRRFALDLRPAVLSGKALARPVEGAQVDRVRAAQNDPDTVRVVLDLPGADRIEAFALEDPPRLVVDVGSRREPAPVASADAEAGGEQGRDEPPVPAETEAEADPAGPPAGEEGGEPGAIRRVVVDAGHGGHDPGAIGPRRVREKDVTLAMAKRLARKLRRDGFEVVLTRRDDRFLALEERTALANTARGDLFVSIHANAHPGRNRAGVETYFLNVTDDRYAARLAARENGADPDEAGRGTDLLRILSDLDARASAGSSRRLAHVVQREITRAVRSGIGDVRDLGVKSALFYVLLGARMPAVLVETGFISNRAEERRLASPRYQEEVAEAMARAIRAFADREERVAAVR
ncbi:MAG TPA: N-acetylmuramoyl-L-alanine amidase [Anaeromyxobacteraceae bacterium]|nr:N-acetylmuramoyl-L-alanine amidase [Anaeromyxobacteraceae bacterium]